MKNRTNTIILVLAIIVILILAGVAFWFLFLNGSQTTNPTNPNGGTQGNGFSPFGKTPE